MGVSRGENSRTMGFDDEFVQEAVRCRVCANTCEMYILLPRER